MRLYVNHQELNNLGNYFSNQSDRIYQVRSSMQKTIDAVSEAWDGPDAQEFRENATEYI